MGPIFDTHSWSKEEDAYGMNVRGLVVPSMQLRMTTAKVVTFRSWSFLIGKVVDTPVS